MTNSDMYVVIAYRWGENTNHSYTVGIFNDLDLAIDCAESHTTFRGGKYGCAVEKCLLNNFDNDSDCYANIVYKTKSIMENLL